MKKNQFFFKYLYTLGTSCIVMNPMYRPFIHFSFFSILNEKINFKYLCTLGTPCIAMNTQNLNKKNQFSFQINIIHNK